MDGIQIKTNSDVNRSLWRCLLDSSNFKSPFQTPEFYDLYNSLAEFSAEVFASENRGEYISLIVVTLHEERGFKRHFSKRGIIYGGPLIKEDSDGLSILLDHINKHYRNNLIYIETRNLFNYQRFSPIFQFSGWVYQPYLNIRNTLSEESMVEIMSHFKYNRRREIKQSLTEGANWALVTSTKEIEEIFAILKKLYSSHVKLPLPDLDFFIKSWHTGIMKIFRVEHMGKIIGGSFCPVLPGHTIFTMYYCGEKNYHPRIFPTHLSVMAAFEYGTNSGCKYLDFMGAGKPGAKYGVRNYKMQFGGRLVEEGRFLMVFKPLLFKVGKLGVNFITKRRS
jgi:hypothetical protein